MVIENSEFNMKGKVALVTGASGLLGRYHCEALLEIGYTVIATDISETGLHNLKSNMQPKYHDQIVIRKLDVTKHSDAVDLRDNLKLNKLLPDTLINNAAINPKVSVNGLKATGRLDEFNHSEFISEINVGLIGYINCSRVFVENMVDNGYGNIINIASDLAVISPDQRIYRKNLELEEIANKKPISYSAIKHAVVGVTKYFSTYYFASGIRCNALSPGGVETDQSAEFKEKLSSLIPLGRMARADEYKGCIKFLASDASSYVNGHNLVADGGRSVW